MVTTSTIVANGLEFSYLAEGDGPLLLCLHGFPDCPRSFRHQFRAFADAGYRVVAPYMRGYKPASIPERGSYQAAALGQDALGLVSALGYDKAVLYGHDWGTSAAYAAALIDPARIERLVVASVPYGPGLPTAFVTDAAQQRRSWYVFFFQSMLAEIAVPWNDHAFIEALWRDWSPGAAIDDAELRAVKDTLSAPGVLSAALGYYRAALNPKLRDPALEAIEQRFGVDAISVPTLYVHGAADGCIGVDVSAGMEPLFTNGFCRVVLDGVGHFVHWEAPETFNRVVLDFLAK